MTVDEMIELKQMCDLETFVEPALLSVALHKGIHAIQLLESFVKKVEEGKAKSVDTYTKYKDFLNSLK